MANYKTPGVYVEEISKFPPSVAQVETAIPAFIGYTEKAEKLNGDSLHLKPTRITSLLEYETFFGSAQPETINVTVDDTVDDTDTITNRTLKVHQPTSKSPFLMYYSMQLYFANGGGPCYITSVGQYGENASPKKTLVLSTELTAGLTEINKEDEPTLLVFPDATSISGTTDFYDLYEQALMQCNKLQDRFTIIDTKHCDETADPKPVQELRDEISLGKDYLKYGAAYYPFLQTVLNYRYDESSVVIEHIRSTPNAVPTALKNLEGIAGDIVHLPENISVNLPDQLDAIRTITVSGDDIGGALGNLIKFMVDKFDMYGSPKDMDETNSELLLPELEDALESLETLIAIKNQIVDDATSVVNSITENISQVNAVDSALDAITNRFDNGTNGIETVYDNLVKLHTKLTKDDKPSKYVTTISSGASNIIDELKKLVEVSITTGGTPDPLYAYTTDVFGGGTSLADDLATLIAAVNTADLDGTDKDNGYMNGRTLDQIVGKDNTIYNQIKVEIDALPLTLPPSAAMAGIYARVDATRGVWKAPANVGLTYVIKPVVQISQDDQGDMNVDTVGGKSINAIRTFTGKGTLVWGARTLAGNDNEWRYINVRRFFNMVEESVGKATEQFVFEGNDASTWVRVRAMIENFLNLQWKAGALAGAKAEQAYYVRVGLGQTMTAQDILEGRMIIEIGMAAVRPAEFIILRFSHKMQEA